MNTIEIFESLAIACAILQVIAIFFKHEKSKKKELACIGGILLLPLASVSLTNKVSLVSVLAFIVTIVVSIWCALTNTKK